VAESFDPKINRYLPVPHSLSLYYPLSLPMWFHFKLSIFMRQQKPWQSNCKLNKYSYDYMPNSLIEIATAAVCLSNFLKHKPCRFIDESKALKNE
jgi:hypothetical protein